MNLLTVRVHGGTRPRLVGSDFEVPLPDAIAEALVRKLGEGAALTLGVRPEHLHLQPEAGAGTISGDPYAIETLGPESLVTLKVDGVLLTVRVFSDEPPEVAGTAHVALDADQLHFFGSDGARIDPV